MPCRTGPIENVYSSEPQIAVSGIYSSTASTAPIEEDSSAYDPSCICELLGLTDLKTSNEDLGHSTDGRKDPHRSLKETKVQIPLDSGMCSMSALRTGPGQAISTSENQFSMLKRSCFLSALLDMPARQV